MKRGEMSRTNMVDRTRHPLRTGLPGRKYYLFDYVTPIVDSMIYTDEKAHGAGMGRIALREERRRERAMMESVGTNSQSIDVSKTIDDMDLDEYCSNTMFSRPSNHITGALCHNCGTTNRSDILVGSDGRFVCKCGAEGGVVMQCDYKDTHDTDKSSARADVYHSSRTIGRGGTISAVLDTTTVPGAAQKKHKLGIAPVMSQRMADKGESVLSRGNQRKLTQIISTVDELLLEIGRVDDKIARKVRMDSEFVFKESLKHHALCRKRECQKSLFEKPSGVIARESFVYTIDQLSSVGMDGVSMQSIVALQQRVRSSSIFNQRDNATQHQSCLAMISALSTSDNCVICPEVQSDDDRRAADVCGKAVNSSMPFRRQDSDVQTTYLVQLRDAISRLSVEYTCASKVRDAAMCAMQDNSFVKNLSDNGIVSHKKTIFATAYIILRSVAEEAGSSDLLKSERHVRRCGLETSDVESMVQKMRLILPKGVVGGHVIEDDELY